MLTEPHTIRLTVNWGELQSHTPYKMIEQGLDWVKLKTKGGIVFVPLNLVDFSEHTQYEDYEQFREYEDEDA